MLEILKIDPEFLLGKSSFLNYEYVITHNGLGYRCGYVNVPENHILVKNKKLISIIICHGGITYSEKDTQNNSMWIGFDCKHYADAIDPNLPSSYKKLEEENEIFKKYFNILSEGKIRNYEYVENECKLICTQLHIISLIKNITLT